MLDTAWCSLVREKLTMARQLLRLASESWHLNTATMNAGLVQAAVALLGEGRWVLLRLVAETDQVAGFEGHDLAQLRGEVGDKPGETQILEGLARDADSWWSRLEALLVQQRQPQERSAQRSDDIIAVAADRGPDRSVAAIESLIRDFRAYFEAFTERHDYW